MPKYDLATFVERTRFPGILKARKRLGNQGVIYYLGEFLEARLSRGFVGAQLRINAWEMYDLVEKLKECGLEQKGEEP